MKYKQSGLEKTSWAAVPAIVSATGAGASEAYLEYLRDNVQTTNTRDAYGRAIRALDAWAAARNLGSLEVLGPQYIADYAAGMSDSGSSASSVKQALAAIRGLFGRLVTLGVLEHDPSRFVRAPKVERRARGTLDLLAGGDTRALLESFDTSTLWGLRNRALVATMLYGFAGVSSALAARVSDYGAAGSQRRLRLTSASGVLIDVPCHQELDASLLAWLDAAGLHKTPDAWLYPAIPGGRRIANRPMSEVTAWSMVKTQAERIGIKQVSCRTFRATGISAFLSQGGRIADAQYLAGHRDPASTLVYAPLPTTGEKLSADIERMRF